MALNLKFRHGDKVKVKQSGVEVSATIEKPTRNGDVILWTVRVADEAHELKGMLLSGLTEDEISV